MLNTLVCCLDQWKKPLRKLTVLVCSLLFATVAFTQISTNGCVAADVGINAGLYANSTFSSGAVIPPAGNVDWFKNATGRNIIDQTNVSSIQSLLQNNFNPTYEVRQNGELGSFTDAVYVNGVRKKYKRLVDAIWSKDFFGGTGGTDMTAFSTASKNGEDPAIWNPGPANVLGKNDLLDVAGHMFRNVDVDANINDLWFTGLINRAEPGGSAYMDFEFFIQQVAYNSATTKLTSGGPDLGHTAFKFDANGIITSLGDMIYNLSLSGGNTPDLEVRIWVSKTDYTTKTPAGFSWGPDFDGAFSGSPYGYASIIPKPGSQICAFVNADGQLPLAPPWGTRNTKTNAYTTNYAPFSVAEVAINLTSVNLDNFLLPGSARDTCSFPWRTYIVKTRASNSFSAALKDFAGPFAWANPTTGITSANTVLSCLNPVSTLVPNPFRNDVTYRWRTPDGNIVGATTGPSIQVNKGGAYYLTMILPSGCPIEADPISITEDPTRPPIRSATTTPTASCLGNTGTVNLSITGGTSPFNIAWTRDGNAYAATTQNLTGLAPGTYVAAITDAKGCSATSTSAVVAAATAVSANSTVTNVTCYGLKNGAIQIAPTGDMPFTYLWSNNQTTQNLTNVGAANYSLIIKDAKGCDWSFNYSITQPSALSVSHVKVNDSDPNVLVGNGSINLAVAGGTPSYTYLWSGPAGFSSPLKDLTSLKYGNYIVVITDAKGCSISDTVFIFEPEVCGDGIDNDGNGLSDCNDGSCNPATPTAITGNNTPCVGQNVTYSTPQSGTLAYQWIVPANATIISGQGTNSIVVSWTTTTPGSICVKANNSGCLSSQFCYSVSIKNVPAAPVAIIKN